MEEPLFSFNAVLIKRDFVGHRQTEIVKKPTISGDSLAEICDNIWTETSPFIVRRAFVQDQSAWWDEKEVPTREDLDSFVTISDRGSRKSYVPSKLTEGLLKIYKTREVLIYIHIFSTNIDSRNKFTTLEVKLLGPWARDRFDEITPQFQDALPPPFEISPVSSDQHFRTDYCRICLETIRTAKIEITNTVQIEFLYLTNTPFDKSTKLSQILCAECYICLRNSFKFKAICVENQRRLLDMFNVRKDLKTKLKIPDKKQTADEPVVFNPPVDSCTKDPLKYENCEEISTVFINVFKEEKLEEEKDEIEEAGRQVRKEADESYVKEEQEPETLNPTDIQKVDNIVVEDEKQREDLIQYYLNLALKGGSKTPPVTGQKKSKNEIMKPSDSDSPKPTPLNLINKDTSSREAQIQKLLNISRTPALKTKKTNKKKDSTTKEDQIEKLDSFSFVTETKKVTQYVDCEICGKPVRKCSYTTHMNSVHEKKVLSVCEICGYKTAWPHALKLHMSKHIKTAEFKCDQCDKVYKCQNYLNGHIRIKHEQKYHAICQYCGKKYQNSSSLKQHIIMNHFDETDKQEFVCDFCGKKFRSKNNLKMHIKSIHMTSPEICKICFLPFRSMKGHLLTHKGQYKHKCSFELDDGSICGKAFRRQGLLDRHVTVHHKNILPFICRRCGKGFSISKSLNEHILADHYNLQLDCLIKGCRTKFRTNRALRGHIKVVHRELSKEDKLKFMKMAMKVPTPDIVN